MTGAGIWRQRALTLRAMAYLALARMAVRFVPFRFYRGALGTPCEDRARGAVSARGPMPTDMQTHLARRIGRAAKRLPGESKCLAQAIALHWMLRGTGDEGELVVAIHRTERSAKHSYHAWLEAGGVMLVGACERSEYRELMRFAYGSAALLECSAGAA